MTYSWDPSTETYSSHLRRRAVLDEQLKGMSSAAQTAGVEIANGIEEQTREILGSMEELSLEIGQISWEINSGLGHISGILESGFSALLHASSEIKSTLDQLVKLAESPEHTRSLENFRHAIFAYKRELWDEALAYVTDAIEGDSFSKGFMLDWHFHWLKGELLLGAPNRSDWTGLNAAGAEQAFLLAARYSRIDDKHESAKSLTMASVSAFAQSDSDGEKLHQMLDYAEEARARDSNLVQAHFQASKAHMALNAPERALPLLEEAIEKDPRFIVFSAEDPSFRRFGDELNDFFEKLRWKRVQGIEEVISGAIEAGLSSESAELKVLRKYTSDASQIGLLELFRSKKVVNMALVRAKRKVLEHRSHQPLNSPPRGRKTCRFCNIDSFENEPLCPSCHSYEWWT
jgi:tetratricopeptide (TPR) repeat protein